MTDWIRIPIPIESEADRRAQQKREDPKPLTLEELRQMDGEPVWIVWPDGRIKSQWWIVGSLEWHNMDFFDPYTPCDYGKTWLAYRHKPKEEV